MPYFTTTDRTHLFYEDWGDGPPIVLVSTWAMSSGMWENQVAFLTQHGLRCITYDRRGTRRADQPSDGYGFDTLADDLAALVDHLGLHDVTLAGHSMGTGEVTRYLTRHGFTGRVAPQITAGRARYWSAWPGAFFGTHLGNPVSAETTGRAVGEAMQTPMMAALSTWHSIFHTDFRSDLRRFPRSSFTARPTRMPFRTSPASRPLN